MAMNSEERATLLRALMAQKQKPPIDEEIFFNDSSTGSRANYTGAPFEPNQTRSWKIGWLMATGTRTTELQNRHRGLDRQQGAVAGQQPHGR
jgi:hypothetical protein